MHGSNFLVRFFFLFFFCVAVLVSRFRGPNFFGPVSPFFFFFFCRGLRSLYLHHPSVLNLGVGWQVSTFAAVI
jgi:hypothetical protein